MTVSVTVYVPGAVYGREAVAPVPVEPSPKSHAYSVIVPSLSDEPEASTEQVKFTHDVVNVATGGTFSVLRSVPITIE